MIKGKLEENKIYYCLLLQFGINKLNYFRVIKMKYIKRKHLNFEYIHTDLNFPKDLIIRTYIPRKWVFDNVDLAIKTAIKFNDELYLDIKNTNSEKDSFYDDK